MNDAPAGNLVAEQLRNVSLFSRCSDYELTLIARRASFVDVPEGAHIVRAGTEGAEMFLLLDGSADVVSGGRTVGSVGPGQYFGELAALLPAPRTADVVASSPCRLAVLGTHTIYTLVDTVPGVARKILEGLAADVRSRLDAG